MQANPEKAEGWLARNAIVVTALNPLIGYSAGAALVQQAWSRELTVLEVALEQAGAGKLLHRTAGAARVAGRARGAPAQRRRRRGRAGPVGRRPGRLPADPGRGGGICSGPTIRRPGVQHQD